MHVLTTLPTSPFGEAARLSIAQSGGPAVSLKSEKNNAGAWRQHCATLWVGRETLTLLLVSGDEQAMMCVGCMSAFSGPLAGWGSGRSLQRLCVIQGVPVDLGQWDGFG